MYITLEEDKPMDKEEVKPTGDGAKSERQEPGFTPGPWMYGWKTANLTNIYAVGGRGSVADVSRWERGIAGVEEENSANARLIAAAPALYAACKAMQKSLNGSATDFAGMLAAHRQLDAALALVDGPLNQETKQMDNEQIERIEIEDEERCEDCGCTPDEGACFYCKMD